MHIWVFTSTLLFLKDYYEYFIHISFCTHAKFVFGLSCYSNCELTGSECEHYLQEFAESLLMPENSQFTKAPVLFICTLRTEKYSGKGMAGL